MIGSVVKINPKTVKVTRIEPGYHNGKTYNRYSQELVKVDGPDVTLWLLKINTVDNR